MTSPKLSHRLTAKLMNFERKLAGFERKVAKLDGLDMVFYENETPRDKPTLVLIHGYTADKREKHCGTALLSYWRRIITLLRPIWQGTARHAMIQMQITASRPRLLG